MGLKPKTRPIGQLVITVNDCRGRKSVIPKGTPARIEGISIAPDSKVSYKIECRRQFVWVKAADLKKA